MKNSKFRQKTNGERKQVNVSYVEMMSTDGCALVSHFCILSEILAEDTARCGMKCVACSDVYQMAAGESPNTNLLE